MREKTIEAMERRKERDRIKSRAKRAARKAARQSSPQSELLALLPQTARMQKRRQIAPLPPMSKAELREMLAKAMQVTAAL